MQCTGIEPTRNKTSSSNYWETINSVLTLHKGSVDSRKHFLKEHELTRVAQVSAVMWAHLAFTASSGAPCSLPWACLAADFCQDRPVKSMGTEGPHSKFIGQLLT